MTADLTTPPPMGDGEREVDMRVRAGLPNNSNEPGYHWVSGRPPITGTDYAFPMFWRDGEWVVLTHVSAVKPGDMFGLGWTRYLGPCPQPSEIATLTADRNAALAEVTRLREAWDDPELDCTDGAHPAWWRGHDHGAMSIVREANRVLDGEPVTGVCREPWEALRHRLAALAGTSETQAAGDGA